MNFKRPLTPALIALALAGSALPATAGAAPFWHTLRRAELTVTEGTVTPVGSSTATTLQTRSAAMRAVQRDGGRHAARARLWFRLRGASDTTKPLGSGLVRRQIGLKLRAKDPCNLVYVMWRDAPENAVAIFVKRNPGQTTSAQCGNRGYTDVATIPMPASAPGRSHTLEARTRRAANGELALSVYTDGSLLRQQRLSAALTAGLDGPIGVRSDNGSYAFRLSARR